MKFTSIYFKASEKKYSSDSAVSLENPCRSNFKNKPALYETQLLLVANEETERGMFERWERAWLVVRGKRVTPFPSLAR